jgi:PPOX class probable F420-dependent enzyme
MASRRDQIEMTDDELRDFLAEQRVVTLATIGPNGRPHLMPLWYALAGDELRGWTYAKSQKAKNLERDPRATLQVEDGVQYEELRGVMFEADVDIERDPAEVATYGVELFKRIVPTEGGRLPDELMQMIEKQAQKRIGLRFVPTRTVSWDHRKLGGTY